MIDRFFERRQLHDPSWYQFLFGNTILAPLWLLARTYVGWQWLQSGYGKITGDGWLNQDGTSLRTFWQRIVQMPEQGQPPIKFDWYRDFIQFMLDHHWYTWFAWVIAISEFTVGILLIIGAFSAIAAIAGATMNFNFMLAGSASTNPVLFLLAGLIILGWKVAGYIGVDRWLLPALGTPWDPGTVWAREDMARVPEPGGAPRARAPRTRTLGPALDGRPHPPAPSPPGGRGSRRRRPVLSYGIATSGRS